MTELPSMHDDLTEAAAVSPEIAQRVREATAQYERERDRLVVTITTPEDVVLFRGRVTRDDEFHLKAEAGQVPRVRLTATGEGAFATTGVPEDQA